MGRSGFGFGLGLGGLLLLAAAPWLDVALHGLPYFLEQKRWLPDPDATSEEVVKSCLEMKATKAYSDCILGSDTREEAERCQ